MANIIIQKDGQTISVNPRKINFVVSGADSSIVESPPKTARIDITALPGVQDLYIVSPNGGELFYYDPIFISSLSLVGPTSGSVYKQYHPLSIEWYKQYLTYVDIYYSINGGNNWIQLASASTDTIYNWTMPQVNTDTPISFKILGNGLEIDTAITDQYTNLTLINPSGSVQTYASGSVIPITWSEVNTPTSSLDYSIDLLNWTTITPSVVGTSYNWNYPGEVYGTVVHVRVKEYPTPYISSTNSFTDNTTSVPLSGMVAWLDASNSSSYTKDGSNNITALTDLSPNHTSFTINTTKLVWNANQKNGLPAYYSNGANNIAILTNYTIQNNSITVFYVAKDTAIQNQSNENPICIDNGANGEYYKFLSGINHTGSTTGSYNVLMGNGSTFAGLPTPITVPYNTWSLYGLTNNGTCNIYYNSATIGQTGDLSSYVSSGLLKIITSVYRPFFGYIGEMLVYNRVLNSTEVTQVVNYLNNKWTVF
jgi:hypothetical protein